MASNIKTRLLIVSDTHGMEFSPADKPTQRADVAIHCGDLTDGAKLAEFWAAIHLLNDINAPLKLVIAGNHDFTVDIEAFEKKVADAVPPLDPELVAKEYGEHGQARQLFEEVKKTGIIFLDEGTHQFTLENGALLKVYASSYTPSLGAWGFQYHPDKGHDFSIGPNVDIAITHGPPRGIMDYTHGRERAGCSHLFEAIAQAKPLVHCFGHIHEGWGAKLVQWKDTSGIAANHFNAINNNDSPVIEKLANLKPSRFDTPEDTQQKSKKLERYNQEKCVATSHCIGDQHPINRGEQTLFVNASYSGSEDMAIQWPWLVDIELPKAG